VKNIKVLLFLFIVGLLSSCISVKKLTFLQDTDEPLEIDTAGYQMLKRSYYKVQKNDLLSVQIRSLNPEVDKYFSLGQSQGNMGAGGQQGGGRQGGGQLYFTGYSVDEFGNIDLPVLNDIYIEGLTINEIQSLLLNKLSKYFDTETLFVKAQLSGIKYTVIGEGVGGQHYLFQNEANIFEALAQAGGAASVFGKNTEVQIMRQHPEGVKFYEVDLTSKKVVSNPMYFIQPNDIINIKPMKQKTWGIGQTGVQSFLLFASLVTTTAALVVLIQSFQ